MSCSAYCVPDNTCDQVTCPTGTTCVETCDGGGGGYPDDPTSPPDGGMPTDGGTPPDGGVVGCHIDCVPTAGSCEEQTTEAGCLGIGYCRPVYEGTDCTCYPGFCTCNQLDYERCETPLD